MYQAYGKSETLSVSGPDPVDVPDAAPSGGGGGAAAASRRIGVCGAVVGGVRAVAGSSLSAGRGGGGRRGGRVRTGSPPRGPCGSTRAGRAPARRTPGGPRRGAAT